MNGWIRCKDRLPDEQCEVITAYRFDSGEWLVCAQVFYPPGSWCTSAGGGPVDMERDWWMPLPEPPDDGNAQD